jgi:hypothetical protein
MCGLLLLLAGTVVLRAQPAPAGLPAPANAPAAAPSTTNALGPRIQFATKEPNFGRVRRGEMVKYTYNFTNTGDQVLHVLNVQPGCGCTHAGEWTKVVEPGKAGGIPIQLNTANFQGDVIKFVTVSTDDKSIPNGIVQLLLKGNIWAPLEVNPQFLNFMLAPDAAQGSGNVVITNNTEEPLYVFDPQCSHPGFKVEVKTNTPGRGYQLTISRVPPLSPGVAQATVTLKTSWTNPPTVTITAWANVQAPITVLPTQLTLAQPPLSNPAPYTITIQNSTTNKMELTEPQVSAPGVKVELKEVIPGKYFNALLTFPMGFEIPPGQRMEFTVKSGLPKNPLITVPIAQLPRPIQVTPAVVPQPARVLPVPPPPRADAR